MKEMVPAVADFSHQLKDAVQRGEEALLKRLYTDNFPKVARMVKENSGNDDDARDVYQEAFLVFWRNARDGRFEPRSASEAGGYLFAVAKNKWMDQLRSPRKKNTVQGSALPELPDQGTGDGLLQEWMPAVKEQYALLGEKCREILNRYYFRKESLREIAQAGGITEASAKNQKYRCIERLRALVRSHIK